VKPLHLRAF